MHASLFQTRIVTPFGRWTVTDDGQHVLGIDYWNDSQCSQNVSPLGKEVERQVLAYLKDARVEFDVPIAPQGTDFQMRVWQLMQAIPKGTVLTYGDAATALNSAARAVGGACKANPIPLIIPCHRIVAKQSIGGFSGKTKGETIDLKMFLLQHEGVLSAKFTGI